MLKKYKGLPTKTSQRPKHQVREVVIEVSGGVATVMLCPPDVKVTIIDHDNEEVGEGE